MMGKRTWGCGVMAGYAIILAVFVLVVAPNEDAPWAGYSSFLFLGAMGLWTWYWIRELRKPRS